MHDMHIAECKYQDRDSKRVYTYQIPTAWLMGFADSIFAVNPEANPTTCYLAAIQHWHEQEMLAELFEREQRKALEN